MGDRGPPEATARAPQATLRPRRSWWWSSTTPHRAPGRSQNRRTGRSPSGSPGAGTPPPFCSSSSGKPRSPTSVGNHPQRRPNCPGGGYQRAESPPSNRTSRSQRPTPGPDHHRVGHQMPGVPTRISTDQRTHRHQTIHACPIPTHQDPHHRSNRTENNYHRTSDHRRSPTTGPARRRTNHRRPGIHRLVPPRPDAATKPRSLASPV